MRALATSDSGTTSSARSEIATPVGTFSATRWRYTALSSGWTRDLWVAGDVVVAYDGLFALEWYEAGASGPRPS